jgi:Uncharacterized protein conserved in bacteria (DUF2188)
MAGKAPFSPPWIAGAAGDVAARPHSSGGDGQHGRDPQAGADLAASTASTGRELIVARREIHIVPGGPQDWIVRADGGRELGHYPSLQAAETVGLKLARRDRGELLVYDAAGKIANRSRPSRGLLGRLFGR